MFKIVLGPISGDGVACGELCDLRATRFGWRQVITAVTERVVFVRSDAGILLEQETGSRRTGLWKLPALPTAHEAQPPPVLMCMQYGITRYRVTLWVHEGTERLTEWPDTHRMIAFHALDSTPMPAPYRRALRDLLKHEEFQLEA